MSLEQDIKGRALELGFDAAGITDASPIGRAHAEHFEVWLRSGYAGPMQYMHRNLEKRLDPAKLLNGARSVMVVALSYKPIETMPTVMRRPSSFGGCHGQTGLSVSFGPAESIIGARSNEFERGTQNQHSSETTPPIEADGAVRQEPIGRIAQYAQYEDYHDFIKSRLRRLADFVQERAGRTHRFKICVDSAPLAEKALAVRAGLGFIGRNHLLIHPQLGPQILLGELITTLELAPDEPASGICAGCDLCLKACPTGALRGDGFLDARACISCLTQYEPSTKIGNWLFGCDECLLACPHQQRAPACANRQFKRYAELSRVTLEEWIGLTPEAFEARFQDSPVGKAGLEAVQRNARICLENLDQGARKMSISLEGNSQPRISIPQDMPRSM